MIFDYPFRLIAVVHVLSLCGGRKRGLCSFFEEIAQSRQDITQTLSTFSFANKTRYKRCSSFGRNEEQREEKADNVWSTIPFWDPVPMIVPTAAGLLNV